MPQDQPTMSHPRGSDWERKILPLRQQAAVTDRWLETRLETVLSEVMRREGFDMLVLLAREGNGEAVMATMLPASAGFRRLAVLLFHLRGDGRLERLTVSRYGYGRFYEAVWDPAKEDQWDCLGRLVRERDPKAIAVDVSEEFALADCLGHTLHERFLRAIGPKCAARVRSGERLALGWLERRTKDEIDSYPGIVQIAHGVIAEAFSGRVIHPGITTPRDVGWWIRQRLWDLGLPTWFHPDIDIQRQGAVEEGGDAPGLDAAILPGDVLHCDAGFHYLGLATDHQEMAYVLRLGEADAPQGLQAALAAGNRLQDIVVAEFVAGRTGNEILRASLARAAAEGIEGRVYTHPLGYHGHGAGPVIGLWDQQEGVSGRGDYELFDDTCYALELVARKAVAEWGDQVVAMPLEQDIVFTGGRVHFLDGRQTRFHLIG
ncbi:MAG: M24 family metallopeptidase [Bacillota bacterium]